MVVNSFTLFALSILLARSVWCLAVNTTTIEGWEIERHEAVLRRSRYLGGYLDGPDGMRVKIVRQEFPYDIGIWSNIKQGMGTRNVFAWLWPFAASPSVESGLRFEVNGFEDPDTTWPPPDPDRMPRVRRHFDPDTAFMHGDTEVEAFRQRQAEDLKRYAQPQGTTHRRLPFHKRFSDPKMVSGHGVEDVGEEDFSDCINEVEGDEEEEGEEAWRNSEGERLGDFGVDEDAEFYDEDDIPLAELIRRRKSAYSSAASFVPKLTTTVLSYLAARPSDRILDIGCGDGLLTASIAASAAAVLGLDASPSFIRTAQSTRSAANLTFAVHDCTRLAARADAVDGSWDKVFSNAALHWILRGAATRRDVLRDVRAALKPGGRFVFEMGGAGNVAEIHAAFLAVLVAHGIPVAKARAANPWFFPSDAWMRAALQDAGFDVERVEIEYRPTPCTPATESGGGLEGWLRLMSAQFLEAVEEGHARESVLRDVLAVLESVVTREEDGNAWIGYVRLRGVAVKR
ncbi:hypothetical protein B0A49_07736 [Cryomyces minteri]|uniref:Methyltransferase type 12 domain-containing protein n=1 Tax=Cryomyces minteri TaxID=331657 RepID=A0A4U0X0C8_9PEZI|nr:hypothetical protein B0A49_07736 [Cryomyces minteri]